MVGFTPATCARWTRAYRTVEGRLKDMIIRGGENIYPRELVKLQFWHPKKPRSCRHRRFSSVMGRRSSSAIDKEEMVAYMRASTLVRRRYHPADGLWQDPEIQATGSLDQG